MMARGQLWLGMYDRGRSSVISYFLVHGTDPAFEGAAGFLQKKLGLKLQAKIKSRKVHRPSTFLETRELT